MKAWTLAVVLASSIQAAAQTQEPSGTEPKEPKEPAPGVFLVSKPSIDGGPFYQSVVLLLSHGETGTLGLIVNRVTEVSFGEAFPNFVDEKSEPDKRAKAHTLSFGGPVALNGLLYLFRSKSKEPPKKAALVMHDVYFASDAEVLRELLEGEYEPEAESRPDPLDGADPHSMLRLFLGHAGWAPGQLDMEILRGDWTLLQADAFTVFQKDPTRLWPELAQGARVVAGLR